MNNRGKLTQLAVSALMMAAAAPMSASIASNSNEVLLAQHSCGNNSCGGRPAPSSNNYSNSSYHAAPGGCNASYPPQKECRAYSGCQATGRPVEDSRYNAPQPNRGYVSYEPYDAYQTYQGTSVPPGPNDGYPSTPRNDKPVFKN